MCQRVIAKKVRLWPFLPLIEAVPLDVALHPLVLDDELHPLEEGRGDGGRVLPQQDVDRLRDRVTKLGLLTHGVFAALGIFTVGKTICKSTKIGKYLLLGGYGMAFFLHKLVAIKVTWLLQSYGPVEKVSKSFLGLGGK